MRVGARLAIILIGVVVGLPVYLLLRGVLRRRTLPCSAAFGNDELRVRAGSASHRIPFRRLELAGLSVERSRRDEVVTFRRV